MRPFSLFILLIFSGCGIFGSKGNGKITHQMQDRYTNQKKSAYCNDLINYLVLPNLVFLPKRGMFSDKRDYFESVFSRNKGCFKKLLKNEIIAIFGEPHELQNGNLMYKFFGKREGEYEYYLFKFNEIGNCFEIENGEKSWAH